MKTPRNKPPRSKYDAHDEMVVRYEVECDEVVRAAVAPLEISYFLSDMSLLHDFARTTSERPDVVRKVRALGIEAEDNDYVWVLGRRLRALRKESMPKRVSRFLDLEVPFSNTPEWEQWKKKCRDLGPKAVRSLLGELRHGSDKHKYGAILALRICGHEAHGRGYGNKLTYVVDEKEIKKRRAWVAKWDDDALRRLAAKNEKTWKLLHKDEED